jgi:mannose-6-phosphate isomerase-like protein (cupin superfamily)
MSTTLTPRQAARTVTGLAALARRYAQDPSSWPLAPRFDAASRWYARIGSDPSHEAWLLTWLPGQSTDLHDHGGSAGAFVVVSGVLTEQAVRAGGPGPISSVEVTLAEGATRSFGSRHVHRIVNAGTVPAVSLHVYAPALREMTRYRIDDGVLSVAVVEQAGVDW